MEMHNLEQQEAADNMANGGDLTGSSAMTVFASELTVFTRQKNYDMLDLLTTLYDAKAGDRHWAYKTKHQGRFILHDMGLNLLGATTPDRLLDSLPSGAINSGFTARIIFVHSTQLGKPKLTFDITDETLKLKDDLIHDLTQIKKLKGQFLFTELAWEKYANWVNSSFGKNPIGDPRFERYVNRRRPHIIKLCMVCSASRSNEMIIKPQDFDRALKILHDVESDMPKIFGGFGASPLASVTQKVFEYIREERKIEYKVLLNRFMDDADSQTLNKILTTLFGAAKISLDIDPYTGQKTIEYNTIEEDL
jgi:hypothetical protein